MAEKNKAKRAEQSEREEYDKMQSEHIKLLGEKEMAKQKEYEAKV